LMRMPMRNTTNGPSISALMRLSITLAMLRSPFFR
jgi:hypothetical protein